MKALTGLALAMSLLSASCATIEAQRPGTTRVSVDNCGAPLDVSVPVTRAVSNDTGVTELLFALGLQDRMAGYFIDAGQDRDVESSPWKAQFGSTTNLGQGFTREAVQAARPDLVFAGWSYGFNETSGLTPDWVRSIGSVPYQLTEACRQPGTVRRGIKPPLDALYEDLTNLGVIFGVQDRAASLIANYRKTIDDVQSRIPHGQPPARVFLYDSGEAEPFTSGKKAAPQQIIEKAGGQNGL
ncbi:ABC transporter substrate-binding protein, partial [Mycobacteroides chelonae]|uniref:ABC transporter substrate-binding protein n=1 Tax=Mycobacteroides chelonae TaxID=1774 RepID=UPI000D6A572A